MIEKEYKLSTNTKKTIEKLVAKEKGQYVHMIFQKGEGLPPHVTNAELFMTVIRGTLSLQMGNQETHKYTKGTMLNLPYKEKMLARNDDDEILELIVVKYVPEGKDKI
ncbi:MAG: hypothetical protein WCR63_00350 [Bacilli bacterium]